MTASSTGARAQGRGQWGLFAFILLVLVAVVAVLLMLARNTPAPELPYSLRSAGPSGLLGLRIWLEDIGYRVHTPGETSTGSRPSVIILVPGAGMTAADRTALRRWVEEGSTLVVANASGLGLSSTFGVTIQTQQTYSDVKLWAAQPVLPSSGREHRRVSGRTLTAVSSAFNTVPIVKTEHGDPAVMLQTLGEGAVWHVGIDGALTNADLRQGWGRDLMIGALRGAPRGSTVEIRNGEVRVTGSSRSGGAAGPDGLEQWLARHPLGWAVLLSAALLLFYLFTQGRRLGPPVVVSDPHRRRAAVEHIEAMARLAQRAGHRDGVARYQKARLKRRLGHSWRVSADLDDEAFVRSLAEQARLSSEKREELSQLLARFEAVKDEGALVELVDAAARFSVGTEV